MTINPDLAVINRGFYQSPFNNPSGLEPTRRLQYSVTGYINGPSGKIMTPDERDTHRIYGATTGGQNTGRVLRINDTRTYEEGPYAYKVRPVNLMGTGILPGDSGALVAYAGRGKRHVAGMVIAGGNQLIDNEPTTVAMYITANTIETALKGQGMNFSHFWGTKSEYRRPSTSTCDNSDC